MSYLRRLQGAFRARPIGEPPSLWQIHLIPITTVLIASLLPALLPVFAVWTIVPPIGFLVFLTWRMLRPELWPAWVGIPLGLWDDIFSGQPFGSAVGLWVLVTIAIDFYDHKVTWRNALRDFTIAALAIAVVIIFAAILAYSDFSLRYVFHQVAFQIALSICCYPPLAHIIAHIDRWRFRLQ